MHVSTQRPEEDAGYCYYRSLRSCKQPCSAGNQAWVGPLREHQVLLTPESYLQPLKQVILKICFNFAIMLGASQDQRPQESS